ncbi:hypothetical protein IMCC3317_00380 [Kordia antarctica]|uniref:Uncharacterized protein n=1 Tax=Kordia antarctica TaxID=1218801 RepID=A0A7L4ZD92_9FLAO|nr:hypothetical protein [Kordia antarctica]QHI34695.1 hypothetical protein IMCC3317_00380 [Kordia antarctica]
MVNNFIDNKGRWLQIANDDFEYSLLFIKSWLPFNAWYCSSYPDLNNNDRKILTVLKNNNNLFRTRIISLLEGEDDESVYFRNNLVQLHNQLELCKVPSVEKSVSFKSLNFRENPNTIFTKTHRNHQFKVEFITPIPPQNYRIKIDVINNNNISILAYQYTKYNLIHFVADNDYQNLSETNQKIILDGFKTLSPRLKESLIVQKRNKSFKKIKEILLTENTDHLSQAIIEILYNLRCILFHGEINPNKDNLKIYKPAFYMLRLLIKSLN